MPKQSGIVRPEPGAQRYGRRWPSKGSEPLSGIAPEDLGDADQRQDRAVNRPMKVADHEADTEGQVEALEDPDGPHADHRNADQAADNPHYYIECSPHAFSSL